MDSTDRLNQCADVRSPRASFGDRRKPDWPGLLQPAPNRQISAGLRVAEGCDRMQRQKAVLCGLARNVAAVLPRTMARMERLGNLFADYRIVIYENDSIDLTAELLALWGERNPRVHVISERRNAPVNPVARCVNRAARMADYRNRCHDFVKEHYADFDAAIVIDTDLDGGWKLHGIADTFGHDDWDFVGSNGIILKRIGATLNVPLQYDAWAFRLNEEMTPLSTAEVNSRWWRVGEPLLPVTSCFGGLGVYRMEAFLSSRYAGWDSEHVPFHFDMRAAGFQRMFLNPSQVTLYGHRMRKSDWWAMPCVRAWSYCKRLITATPGMPSSSTREGRIVLPLELGVPTS